MNIMTQTGYENGCVALQKECSLQDLGRSKEVYSKRAKYGRGQTHNTRNILFILLCIVCSEPTSAATISKGNDKASVCWSDQCFKFSERLLTTMDFSVNPCDDFYQYVCGNINSQFNLPKDSSLSYDWFNYSNEIVFIKLRNKLRSNVTQYPKPVQQAKDLFDLCMDTDKVEKKAVSLLRTLNLPPYPSLVGTPIGQLDRSTYSFDWLDTIIRIKTHLGMDVLIFFDLNTDLNNSHVYRLSIGAPESTYVFPSIDNEKQRYIRGRSESYNFLNIISTDKIDLDYGKLSEKQLAKDDKYLKLISLYSDIKLNESEYSNINRSFHDFRNKINKLIQEVPDNRQHMNTCIDNVNEYSINDIQSHTDKYVESKNGSPQPIWKRYLEGVFNASDVKLDFEQDKVLVSSLDMKYMDKMALLISETDPVILELYIWLEVVDKLADSTEYSDADRLRSLQCAQTVNKMFGMAATYALVPRNLLTYVDFLKHKALTMIGEIKNALENIVTKNQWMDNETKQSIYEKIRTMNPSIGIPEWLFKPGKLEEYYEGIEVNRNNTYLENMVNILRAKLKKHLNSYRQPDSLCWFRNPTEANAFNSLNRNTITVELTMILYPFFNLGLDSLNYGSLGTVIGHEITHGFDNCGRKFDKNGNLFQWWSNNSLEHFVNKTKCFVDQYSSYNASEIITEVNKNVDGSKTLNENIADNGGLRVALAALQHHLEQHGPEKKLPLFGDMTSEQTFFLSYAHTWCEAKTAAVDSLRNQLKNVHPPNMFRVRGTLQNSEEFAKAWNCPPGSPMNPHRERCIIF